MKQLCENQMQNSAVVLLKDKAVQSQWYVAMWPIKLIVVAHLMQNVTCMQTKIRGCEATWLWYTADFGPLVIWN